MRLRSELDAFSQNITNFAARWNGSESVYFSVPTKYGHEEITSVSTMCTNLSARITAFIKKDKSLQGRIDTLGRASLALAAITNTVHVQKPWHKRILSYFGYYQTEQETKIYDLKKKIDALLSKYKYKHIRVHVGEGIIWRILNVFGVTFRNFILMGTNLHSNSEKCKIVMNAFRVVKLEGIFSNIQIDSSFGGGHFSEVSKSLQQDLLEFQTHVSEGVKNKIAPFIRSLELADKIGKHLTVASLLISLKLKAIKIPFMDVKHFERKVKHEQRDLAYEIEKSVKDLDIGEVLIIPCGYTDASTAHAVAMTIKKVQNDSFELACHNTGDGAEAAQGLLGWFQMLYKWRMYLPTFENVPLNTTVKQPMLTKILDLNKDSYWQPVYKLRPFMQNRGIQDVLKDSVELQTWGTCSYDSIMSCLSHDMPPSVFLVLQLFMMQKAQQNLRASLPGARANKLFNEFTLNLLGDSPQKNIDAHIKLCREFFHSFHDNEHYTFTNQAELKARIEHARDSLLALETQEATYTATFFTLGRSDLLDIQDKIKKEKELFTALRGIIKYATPSGQLDLILNKSDHEFAAYLLTNDLRSIIDHKNTILELSELFDTLTRRL